MPKRPKNGFKKPKMRKSGRLVESQIKHCKPFLRVKYNPGTNFFDFPKDLQEIEAKNTKLHYANELKVFLANI